MLFSFSHYVVSDSLQPHGLQHTRLPCPSVSPGVCSDSCPLSQWCYITTSSSVAPWPFAFNLSSIWAFSNELALCTRWPKYRIFSFSISPSSEYSGLNSFRIDWFYLLGVQGTLKSLLHHNSKDSFFGAQPSLWSMSHIQHNYWKNHCFDYPDLCRQSDISAY